MLLIISIFVCSIVAEGILRLVVDPVDFLSPDIVSDEILGYKITPGTGHHDEWGFRNAEVPEKVDIVTIGDSQTYGDGAPAKHAWPVELASITGKSVYNLSLGGYGPPQYLYLLKEKAVKLKPSIIIIGFYIGNEFFNSAEMVSSKDYWREYADSDFEFQTFAHTTAEVVQSESVHIGKIRHWIGMHSIICRMGSLNAKQAKYRHFIKNMRNSRDVFMIEADEHITTGFKSATRYEQIDFENESYQAAYEITIDFLREMKAVCDSNGIELSILLIPSKELVYEEYIKPLEYSAAVLAAQKVIESEKKWREKFIPAIEGLGLNYSDSLDDLRRELKSQRIYHPNFNDHSNSAGYRIIAESAASLAAPINLKLDK